MLKNSAALLCVAYIVGLLCASLPGRWWGLPVGAIALVLFCLLAIAGSRWWKTGPTAKTWLAVGLVSVGASFYAQFALPRPASTDVAQWVRDPALESVEVSLMGQVDSAPRLTQSQKIQFQLAVTAAKSAEATAWEARTGAVYATVPLLQGTGLHPGQVVQVSGVLYRPKPAANPGGFDFAVYLSRQGIFAGLRGQTVEIQPLRHPSLTQQVQTALWRVQQRIIQAQVGGLGVPAGPLLSAITIGRNGVDLGYDLKTRFSQVGLAHALAASGFQVSLLISVVVGLTQRSPAPLRVGIGLTVIAGYIALTGLQPAVLRAGLMGAAALLALTHDRKLNSFGLLLLAATLLLLVRPIWILDLGFQFSFLATLGLLVTVPVLNRWFDWLPTAIAPLVTVPLAAYLWTLPLQIGTFGVVSPYSIPINVLTTPLITGISFGGMISGVAALIHPTLGRAIAMPLYYPTHGLIALVDWSSQLPGSSLAVGQISLPSLLGLYGLMGLIWWRSHWHRHWWVAGLLGLSAVLLPAWYRASLLSQVTVLATTGAPVMVVQQPGSVGLVNVGNEADVNFTLLPFLRQQGVNRIDWAIASAPASRSSQAWVSLVTAIPVRGLYHPASSEGTPTTPGAPDPTALSLGEGQPMPLMAMQPTAVGSEMLQAIAIQPTVIELCWRDQAWLLISDTQAPLDPLLAALPQLPAPTVLWWTGSDLPPTVLDNLHPQVAIASARAIAPATADWLQHHQVATYVTGEQGAVQWSRDRGITPILEPPMG